MGVSRQLLDSQLDFLESLYISYGVTGRKGGQQLGHHGKGPIASSGYLQDDWDGQDLLLLRRRTHGSDHQ